MKRLKLPLLLILRKWNIPHIIIKVLRILTVSMLPKYSELIYRFLLLLSPIFILLFFVILDLHLLLDDIRENPWVPLINLLKLIHDILDVDVFVEETPQVAGNLTAVFLDLLFRNEVMSFYFFFDNVEEHTYGLQTNFSIF